MHVQKSSFKGKDEELSFIIKSCLEHREWLLASSPLLAFPQNFSCFIYKVRGTGLTKLPITIELILHLWATSPRWRVNCPDCGLRSVYGVGAGGLLADGGITGHCIKCHRRWKIRMGGVANTGRLLKEDLAGSRFERDGLDFNGTGSTVRKRLLRRLRELKVRRLRAA